MFTLPVLCLHYPFYVYITRFVFTLFVFTLPAWIGLSEFVELTNLFKYFVFLLQSKLLSSELLDTIASQFNLKEKDYFGLAYKDET